VNVQPNASERVFITRNAKVKLRSAMRRSRRREVVAALTARDDSPRLLSQVTFLRNRSANPLAFVVRPSDLDIPRPDGVAVALFHSHPLGGLDPSQADLRTLGRLEGWYLTIGAFRPSRRLHLVGLRLRGADVVEFPITVRPARAQWR
jgi:proteasome lid subunit RPN8/RPN11